MPIAREGLKEIALGTLILGGLATGAFWIHPVLAAPFAITWVWVLAFFRDPQRIRHYADGELCSPADGTITEIAELPAHPVIGGPAIRIGMFLSLFNVHINRSPCGGTIKDIHHRPGEFLDARHPESGKRNESNSLTIEPEAPLSGPFVVRQVAGLVARRIVCHAKVGDRVRIGERFGLIKFGSRTELIIPNRAGTEIAVALGDKVRAGLTILVRQPVVSLSALDVEGGVEGRGRLPSAADPRNTRSETQ